MSSSATSKRFSQYCGPLRPILFFLLAAWLFLTMSRLLLVIWQWDRVIAVDGLWQVFLFGIRMDTILLCYAMILPCLIALILPRWSLVQRLWAFLLATWITLWSVLLVFMELATPSYINEYDGRPARLFVEYLMYPREVFSTLFKAYLPQLLISTVLCTALAFFVWRAVRRITLQSSPWAWWVRLLALPLVAIILFLGIRSSLDHRAANPSTAAFSRDHLVNDLALNSSYSMLYAVYAMYNEADAARTYTHMPYEQIVKTMQSTTGLTSNAFINSRLPSLHHQSPTQHRKKPLNVVIILEESLGAQFVKSLGGLPLTPHLEELAQQGLWFTQLYATGTRSVRGIEAVLSGFPPTPARSVVKLGLSQRNFYTLARTFKQNGYKNLFIYGGESQFDNMKSFFMGNGFDKAIDENSYDTPEFRGSWGVSDEDLFTKANTVFKQQGDQPFFAFVFTTSLHTPFEFPAGKIQLYEQPQNTLHNAVKYADYALGQFFKKARKEAYWKNTVFLIVADHDSRVFGASLVPVKHFHIPALIIGPGIQPSHYTKVASQIDLPPTLLSLAGIDNNNPMIGHDLTRQSTEPGQALMQYGRTHAYRLGDDIIIREPGKEPHQYRYEHGKLIPQKTINPTLAKKELALVLWPSLAYRKLLHRSGA